jgi:hypothetical protein
MRLFIFAAVVLTQSLAFADHPGRFWSRQPAPVPGVVDQRVTRDRMEALERSRQAHPGRTPRREGRPAQHRRAQQRDLELLKQAVRSQPFSSNKLDVLKQAAAGSRWFQVCEVEELLTEFFFSADKLEVMRILKPRILDPENAHRLNNTFHFSSDRAELQAILAG